MNIFDVDRLTAVARESLEIEVILDLLILYNPRALEILRLVKSDVVQDRFLIIRGAKRSQDIIVRDRELMSKINRLAKKRTDRLFISTTYGYLYRYIRLNFGDLIKCIDKKKNCKVTHLFRYLNTLGINDESSLKALLHHNSKSSQKYYINKIRS